MLGFAEKLTGTFIELFDECDGDDYMSEDEWYKMIYNALVLLMSAREKILNYYF